MNADTTVRPLTVEDSNTNRAWEIYTSLAPMAKLDLANKFNNVKSLTGKQTASVNYIEDHIADFC